MQFYSMVYELDEVERPDNKVIEDDEALDRWYASYRDSIKKRLIKHHKDMGTKDVDYGVPKPRRGYVFGKGEKKCVE